MPYTLWDRIWPPLFVVLALSLVVAVAVLVIRKMRRDRDPGSATSDGIGVARERCIAKASALFDRWQASNPGLGPGPMVTIVFHTYSGLVVYMTQVRHELRLPSRAARLLLWELVKFNLSHGMLGPGCLYVPLLTWMEYRSQLRRIAARERALGGV